jgi:hypothetical protein
MSASKPVSNSTHKRKPYRKPTLTRLAPEAARDALEVLDDDQADKPRAPGKSSPNSRRAGRHDPSQVEVGK